MTCYPQRCKLCGKRDKFNFHITDKKWKEIVPEHYQNHVICLSCFDLFASARGINYSDDLDKELCFVGDKACFTFYIENKEDAIARM